MFRKNIDKYFVILILLFFLLKSSILLTSNDLHDNEECIRGAVAKILIESKSNISWFQLQQDPYTGGSLFAGILAIPLFLIFGISTLVLKLEAFIISFLILMSAYLFMKKFFDTKAAFISGLFFIFSPYFFTKLSLITWGGYLDSILFSIIIMFLFFKIFFYNDKNFYNKTNNYLFILFGLISGFAVWNQYSSLVMIFLCFIFWFLFDKFFFIRKSFLIFFLFFLIGFSPWIVYNSFNDFSGIYYPGNPGSISAFFLEFKESFYANNIINFFSKIIPNSFNFKDIFLLKSIWLNHIYYFFFLFSFLFLIYMNRNKLLFFVKSFIKKSENYDFKELFILSYFVIFYFVFQIMGVGVNPIEQWKGYIHISFIYPFIFFILGISLYKLFSQRNKLIKFFSLVIIIILLLQGLTSNLQFISINTSTIKTSEPVCMDGLAINAGMNYFMFSRNEEVLTFCNSFEYKSNIRACIQGLGAGEYIFRKNSSISDCELFEEDMKADCIIGRNLVKSGFLY